MLLTSIQVAVNAALETTLAHVVATPGLQRAVEAAASTDPISGFLQYGVLGLVVVGFVSGWIVPGPQAKALAAENARLAGVIDQQIFPMLERYAATMEKAAAALEKSAEAMDRQAHREVSRSSPRQPSPRDQAGG